MTKATPAGFGSNVELDAGTNERRPPINELTALDRFRRFFAANPHELLTRKDAQTKFYLTERQLDHALRTLRLEGTVETGSMIWAGAKVKVRKPR